MKLKKLVSFIIYLTIFIKIQMNNINVIKWILFYALSNYVNIQIVGNNWATVLYHS